MDKQSRNALLLGLVSLVIIAISNIIELMSAKITSISWFASIFIVAEIIYLRFVVIDPEEFTQMIQGTNPFNFTLKPQRFLNWMVIAMIMGLLATIIIYYNFIFGMISYLLTHICLFVAFSGIFSLNPMHYYKEGKSGPLISVISWLLIIVLVYIFGVYNGSESLIVIPYVLFLGTMAHYTWYNLSFPDRPPWFNRFPIISSALFVFSDAMIGNAKFGPIKLPSVWFHFIDSTYVLNLCGINEN